jgi:serine/threonine-protein kinase
MATRRAATESFVRARETVVDERVGNLPAIGDLVGGKYRIAHLLGNGSMGAVFAARDEVLGRDVAIKMMWQAHAYSPDLVSRFFNEARAAARIESEHVARIFEVGQTDQDVPFMALELLDGEDLAQTLESRRPIPLPQLVGWILEALEGLAEAHSLGIIHRDLKPANLFLAHKRDGTSIIKLLDFGVSKDQRASRDAPKLTVTTALVGSPAYMSPEQLRDPRAVDARADIWALGVVLYELLARRLPFQGSNVADLCVAIIEHQLEPVRSHRRDVPAALDDVVARCLASDPEARFPDIAALAKALVPFAPPGADMAAERIRHILRTKPRPSSQDLRARRSWRRRFRVLAALGVSSLIAIGIAATSLATAKPASAPRLSNNHASSASPAATAQPAP